MPNGIDQLYRTAIEKLAKSADADIEHCPSSEHLAQVAA